VRVVVPSPPGGTTDFVARHWADFLRGRLGQPVVVENRPGAATNIGTELVARAEPDGTTLLLGVGLLVSNPIWGPKPGLDPATALAPVSMVSETQFLLAAGPRFGAEGPAGLVAAARAQPNRHSVSSAQLDLTVARLTRALGIRLEHVGYRGGAPAMTDAIAGQVDMVVALVPVLLPSVREGQLRPIGVTGPRRSAVLPSVPSFVEAGYPAATETSWNALFAPAGTPPEVVAKLNEAALTAMKDPEMIARMDEFSTEIVGSTPEELAEHVKAEMEKWEPVVTEANVTLD